MERNGKCQNPYLGKILKLSNFETFQVWHIQLQTLSKFFQKGAKIGIWHCQFWHFPISRMDVLDLLLLLTPAAAADAAVLNEFFTFYPMRFPSFSPPQILKMRWNERREQKEEKRRSLFEFIALLLQLDQGRRIHFEFQDFHHFLHGGRGEIFGSKMFLLCNSSSRDANINHKSERCKGPKNKTRLRSNNWEKRFAQSFPT